MTIKKNFYITARLSVGGAEKFMISLTNSLNNLPSLQQTIISLHADNPLKDEINSGTEFLCFPRKYKMDITPLFRLRRLIRTERPDIIFCLNFFSYFIIKCATIGLRLGSRKIISYHSTTHSNRKEKILHWMYTSMLNRNDVIVTVSKNQAAYTSSHYHISSKKFTTIHNGVNINYWKPPPIGWNDTLIRSNYNIPISSKIIIIVATLRPEKNHIGAVKALQILHKRYNEKAYLLLVGDGIMKEEIEKIAIALEINEYVKFAGNQKDVRPFYWASDIFSLSSKSVETFSIAALEAMACGLPGVLTNIGGAAEIIQEPKNGYLCAVNEESIAISWLKAIKREFCKKEISEYIHTNYSLSKMSSEYNFFFNSIGIS